MEFQSSRRQFLVEAGSACVALTTPVSAAESVPTVADHDGRFRNVKDLFADAAADAIDGADATGAVVALVEGNELVHGAGYGHTVLDADEPIAFEESRFNLGSAVKPLTYTAALTLVDDRRIAVDDNVSDHLESVSISDTYDEPITLEHLVTHTAGFEMRAEADSASDIDDVEPLPESLSNQQPDRIHPPSNVPVYTNYAPALTGQLLADIAGDSYDDAMKDMLLDPLGMETATFDPSPDGLGGGPGDSLHDDLSWYSNVAPASGLCATGQDVARFLQAYVTDGANEHGRALSSTAIETAHEQWYTPHERLHGMAWGFFERFRGTTRFLYHDGSVPGFNATILVVPEEEVGLFVATQGDQPFGAREQLINVFLDEYYPDDTNSEEPPAPSEQPDDTLLGTYLFGQGVETTTYERALLVAFGSQSITIEADEDGYLVVDDGEGDPSRYVEVEEDVFRRADGERTLVFTRDDGEITHVFTSESPMVPMVPKHPLDDLTISAAIAGVSLFVMTTALLAWPARMALRRYRGTSPVPPAALRPGIAGAVTAAWPFTFLLSFLLLYSVVPTAGASAHPPGFEAVFYVPLVGAVASLVAIGYAVNAVRMSNVSLAWIHYLVVAVASLVLFVVVSHWNAVGSQF